jgi:hypothetical protein
MAPSDEWRQEGESLACDLELDDFAPSNIAGLG